MSKDAASILCILGIVGWLWWVFSSAANPTGVLIVYAVVGTLCGFIGYMLGTGSHEHTKGDAFLGVSGGLFVAAIILSFFFFVWGSGDTAVHRVH